MALGLSEGFLEREEGIAGGDGGVAKAEDGGVDVLFAKEFDEGVYVVGALAAADEGITLDVFAFAGGGEGGVEEAGGVGGGGFFVVFGEPDGDGGLVQHAVLNVRDVVRGGEDFAEEAGDFGFGGGFGVG